MLVGIWWCLAPRLPKITESSDRADRMAKRVKMLAAQA